MILLRRECLGREAVFSARHQGLNKRGELSCQEQAPSAETLGDHQQNRDDPQDDLAVDDLVASGADG